MQEILIVKSVLDYINDHSKEMNLPCELELEDIAPVSYTHLPSPRDRG